MHLQNITVRNNKTNILPKATEQENKSTELRYFSQQEVKQAIDNESTKSAPRSDQGPAIAIPIATSSKLIEKAATSNTTNNLTPVNLAIQQQKQSLFTGFKNMLTKGVAAVSKSVKSTWHFIGAKLTGLFKSTSISQAETVEMDDTIIENSIDKLLPKIEILTQERDAIKISAQAKTSDEIEEALGLLSKKISITNEIINLNRLAIENFETKKSQGVTKAGLRLKTIENVNIGLKDDLLAQKLKKQARSAAAAA